jgi:hypothetical protein
VTAVGGSLTILLIIGVIIITLVENLLHLLGWRLLGVDVVYCSGNEAAAGANIIGMAYAYIEVNGYQREGVNGVVLVSTCIVKCVSNPGFRVAAEIGKVGALELMLNVLDVRFGPF